MEKLKSTMQDLDGEKNLRINSTQKLNKRISELE